MDTLQAVQNRIITLCRQKGYSIRGLANAAGIPPGTLKNIIYGKSRNPGVVTIKKLCDALEITLGEFFSDPDFDALEQEMK